MLGRGIIAEQHGCLEATSTCPSERDTEIDCNGPSTAIGVHVCTFVPMQHQAEESLLSPRCDNASSVLGRRHAGSDLVLAWHFYEPTCLATDDGLDDWESGQRDAHGHRGFDPALHSTAAARLQATQKVQLME